MVCANVASWVLPFQKSDFFVTLSDAQFSMEIEKAQNRAIYIMLTSATKETNPGWGISQTEWDLDESGQIEESFILLTSAEFIKKFLGIVKQANLLRNYTSPTGESSSLQVDQYEKWLELSCFLRDKAWNVAYPYISEDAKKLGFDGMVVALNYNFQTLEKEYHQEIYPTYNPLPYINRDVWEGGYW